MQSKDSLSRRRFFQAGAAAPLVGAAACASGAEAVSDPGPKVLEDIYGKLGVRPFINAVGTITVFSGTLMSAETHAAMEAASQSFVKIADLQAAVGKRLAELSGAEDAIVTAGASAALCCASLAATVGDDVEKMKRVPDLTGSKDEFILQKLHRNPYDHAFRMTGAKLIEVETAEQMSKAIGPKTAFCAFVRSHHTLETPVELEEYTAIAHEHGLPVVLDAAAELPPKENFSKFVGMGVDMVAFSGGKNLRGPQCSGMLLGKREWIRKAYANAAPANYFARIAKVGKEEMVGLLSAVEQYMAKDHEAERAEYHAKLERIAKQLEGLDTVLTEFIPNNDFSHSPRLSVQWDEDKLGLSLEQMIEKLREGEPSIEASDMRRFNPPWKGLGIFPYLLKDGEEMIIAERVREILTEKA